MKMLTNAEVALKLKGSPEVRKLHEHYKQRYAKFSVSNVRPLLMEGVEPDAVYPQECFHQRFFMPLIQTG